MFLKGKNRREKLTSQYQDLIRQGLKHAEDSQANTGPSDFWGFLLESQVGALLRRNELSVELKLNVS